MTWVAVGLVACASYLLRVLAFVVPSRRPPAPRTEVALRDAGMGGLTALAVISALGVAAAAPGVVVVGLAVSAVVVAVGALTGRSMARTVIAGTVVVSVAWALVALG